MKTPKIYMADTGLLCHLTNQGAEGIAKRPTLAQRSSAAIYGTSRAYATPRASSGCCVHAIAVSGQMGS